MLASSPMISTPGSEYTSGTITRIASASPGPTPITSDSVVKAPPEVLKYMMNTSGSVVSARESLGASMAAEYSRARRSWPARSAGSRCTAPPDSLDR